MARIPRPDDAPEQRFRTRTKNGRRAWFADAYHFILTVSWPRFIAIIMSGYLSANLLFAGIYWMIPQSINGARGFADHYFFSVQTWATIGYGSLTPNGFLANMVVVFESMIGIFGVALLTGVLFAKFAHAKARVLFARRAVVTSYNGKPTLMIRLANERGNNIVDASAQMTLLHEEISAEGQVMRRLFDLQLVRQNQPMFRLSWTIMHVIDERSPLYQLTAEQLEARGDQVFVTLTGHDASVGQIAHASATYRASDVVFGRRYADVTTREGDALVLDFSRFHDTE